MTPHHATASLLPSRPASSLDVDKTRSSTETLSSSAGEAPMQSHQLELQPLTQVSQYRDALVHLGAGLVARLTDKHGTPVDRDSLTCPANHAWGSAADNFLEFFSTEKGLRIHYRSIDTTIPAATGWELRTPPPPPLNIDRCDDDSPQLKASVRSRGQSTITRPQPNEDRIVPNAHAWLSHPILMRILRDYLYEQWSRPTVIGCINNGNLIAIPINDTPSLLRAHQWLNNHWPDSTFEVFRQLWKIDNHFPEPWACPEKQVQWNLGSSCSQTEPILGTIHASDSALSRHTTYMPTPPSSYYGVRDH
ncbi:hypothetical protein Q0N40_04195 [Corynebacterium pseudokroppenstedtii]|uniref:Uncharacterized protein n=1 Tax=Corynebacterium pseudokroppenstedtii TaxID=2804917 RepID=A0AAU0PZN7_9CORY|nr:hypothetical protein [Corynebacterium pseudokroppenstedtii]QRP15106.1 hypothetical protein I6J24_03655 [Corynebacterium kroppenstedtii]MBY0790965.1 hypothetical protein [Corynebacterium pseudokroppenstedtii]MCF6792779.1 hypothetical protein [Corynebacterium pseudokroppenstedtii]MCF8702721.1 hypothetical protein [Corynebacterium pseudokroppenstedtii]MCG2636235.1 hypothetical protein [Corynebacterium pseudokroppenstedtii]